MSAHVSARKKNRGGSRPGRKLSAWQKSARFKSVALAALKKINRRRDLFPHCTATAKSTGEQCKNLAIRGQTKCRFHGGVTPKGDHWHEPRWPKPSDPKAMEKIDRKLRERTRNAKERDARLASLSPEMRQRYAAWIRAHKPGLAAERRRAGERRRQDAEAKALHDELLSRPPEPPSPELAAIQKRIAALKAEKAEIEAAPLDLGVFG